MNGFLKVEGNKRNYTQEALKNNTVYLSAPVSFDDPYDCNIFVDPLEFALQRISYYALLCGVQIVDKPNYDDLAENIAHRIYKHICDGEQIETLFKYNNENELIHARQEYFILSLKKRC